MYKSLKEIRVLKGDLSQNEVASMLGVSVCAYSLIESGKRTGSVKTWAKIQSIFKLTDEETWKLIKSNKKE